MDPAAQRRPLILYHGSHCLDGFGSAFAAWMYFAVRQEVQAEYRPIVHGEPVPDASGRDIYLLDFAFGRADTALLCQSARQVTVLDHHITVKRDLDGLESRLGNLELVLDMERSGCVITWEYFHKAPPPHLLAHIQDRDLWQRRIPASEDVTAALMGHPQEFELWKRICESDAILAELVTEGRAINRYRHQLIEQYRQQVVSGTIAGYQVPVVNCPRSIVSELLGDLAEGQPFAAAYTDHGLTRKWSLRSAASGVNVATIAEAFGGGGHARAAGFSTRLPPDLLKVEADGPS